MKPIVNVGTFMLAQLEHLNACFIQVADFFLLLHAKSYCHIHYHAQSARIDCMICFCWWLKTNRLLQGNGCMVASLAQWCGHKGLCCFFFTYHLGSYEFCMHTQAHTRPQGIMLQIFIIILF